jgi:hypothetical protein
MTSASEYLSTIYERVIPGVRFPEWTVATRSGHLVALISEVPASRSRWWHEQTVRGDTMAAMLDAGLVTLGDEEPVPEYEGRRYGLRWEPGRVGRRLFVTEKGEAVLAGR